MRLLGILSEEQIQSLNFSALASFWQSELGQDLSKQGPQVNREMPFTARFTRTELVNLKIPIDDSLEDSEYVTVQGIVDLVIVFEEAIWIVDFKTDQLVTEEAMNERAQAYRPQLELYRSALSRLFQKPVQKGSPLLPQQPTSCRGFVLVRLLSGLLREDPALLLFR